MMMMMSKRFFFAMVMVLGLLGSVYSQCSIQDPSGNTINLGTLTNNAQDYIIQYDPLDNRKKIWVNMCRPTLQTLCGTSSSACQQWDPNNRNGQASLGDASTLQLAWGTQQSGASGPVASYGNGSPANGVPRSMQIDFTCDQAAGAGNPVYVNEIQLKYYFTWSTSAACVSSDNNGGGSSTSHGLSGGSIILIILLCCVVVYLVGGIVFKKVRMHAEGIEMLPNVEFWTSLPGLVKDGFKFIINKVTGRGNSYSQVK